MFSLLPSIKRSATEPMAATEYAKCMLSQVICNPMRFLSIPGPLGWPADSTENCAVQIWHLYMPIRFLKSNVQFHVHVPGLCKETSVNLREIIHTITMFYKNWL